MKSILTRVAFVALCVVMLGQYVSTTQAMINEHSDTPPEDSGPPDSGGSWIDDIGDAIGDILDEAGDILDEARDRLEDIGECAVLLGAIAYTCGKTAYECLKEGDLSCLELEDVFRTTTCVELGGRLVEECF